MRVYVILLVLVFCIQSIQAQTTYTVTSSSDESDFDIEDGLFDPPTLRSAIENANRTAGIDFIRFSGIDKISLSNTLPSIMYPIDIDGELNSNERLILDGSTISSHTAQGLLFGINADNSTIKRLTIVNFFLGGLLVSGDNITLDSLSIGTEDGTTAHPNGDQFTFQTTPAVHIRGNFNEISNSLISGNNGHGIRFNPFSDSMNVSINNNIIGLDSAGVGKLENLGHGILISNGRYFIDDNIITGNGQSGIVIEGTDEVDFNSRLEQNLIGLNKEQTSIGNENFGVDISADFVEMTYNTISGNSIGILLGGDNAKIENNIIGKERISSTNNGNENYGIFTSGEFNTVRYNTISGNQSSGIYIASDANLIQENRIGLNVDGDSVISNLKNGIEFEDSSRENEIIGNLISGNINDGIYLEGNNESTKIIRNYIGTDDTGTIGLSNQGNGIALINASGVEIGSSNVVDGNIISSNGLHGINSIVTTLRPDTLAQLEIGNNFIGVDVDGDQALGNGLSGITLQNYESLVFDNVISGNNGSGLVVNGRKNMIEYNFIGTNSAGINSLENAAHGIELRADSNFVGNPHNENSGNVISGNRLSGILVFSFSQFNTFAYNFIGVDEPGELELSNGHNGISFGSGTKNHLVKNNLISGNEQSGIRLFKNNKLIQIIGNIIGADATGQFEISNLGSGIHITDGDEIELGLPEFGSKNLISGNKGYGIRIDGQLSTDNPKGISIKNNTIGAQLDEVDPLKNYRGGIRLFNSTKVTIGGEYGSFDSNVIAGNDTLGIYILDNAETPIGKKDSITISGNYIGLSSLLQPIPNAGRGMYIYNYFDGGSIKIGDNFESHKNIISYNSYSGISVGGPRPVNIDINEFYDNGYLAIDLNDDGVSFNDEIDEDGSANYGINYPVIGSAFYDETDEKLTIYSSFIDVPSIQTYSADYFYNESCDESGYGEGQYYLESFNLYIDELGVIEDSIIVSLPKIDIDGYNGIYLTSIIRSTTTGTSELSQCFYFSLDGESNFTDLIISKTDNLDQIVSNENLAEWEYEILVKNIGSFSASDVMIKDTLDQNLSIQEAGLSISKGTVSINEHIVSGNIIDLMPGDSVLLKIPVEGSISKEIINKAYVSMSETDLTPNNNVDSDTTEVLIEVAEELQEEIPTEFSLEQNYPNPFNPNTTINYTVSEATFVEIKIYNTLGVEVKTLVNEVKSPGVYSINWDARNFASGFYIYKMDAGTFTSTKKMLLIK